jgi:carbon storage regulator
MLVLSRKLGEELVIADNIRVKVIAVNGRRVTLGIEAPDDVRVLRAEIDFFRDDAAKPDARELVPSRPDVLKLPRCNSALLN